jgi:hypothetical protein
MGTTGRINARLPERIEFKAPLYPGETVPKRGRHVVELVCIASV